MQSPENLRHSFYLLQILLGLTSVGVVWLMFRASQSKTGFKVREADRQRNQRSNPKAEKANEKKPPLLTGLRIDGSAHEILGISPDSNANQIQEAYMNLIKRFHPDKVGPPGSREWKDAQTIAAAINNARNSMMEKFQKH